MTEANNLFPVAFRNIDDVAVLKNIRKWVGESVFWRMTVKTPTDCTTIISQQIPAFLCRSCLECLAVLEDLSDGCGKVGQVRLGT
jgi:hypothetical protein